MLSSFLGLNNQSGTTPQVRRFNGLSSSLVGNTFGTVESFSVEEQALNRVIQFGSQNTFLALVSNNVYRSTNAGVTWSVVHTMAGVSGLTSGLNVIYINGVATVTFIWAVDASTMRGSYSTNGIVWTNDPTTSTNTSGFTCYSSDTIFRNSLCVTPLPTTSNSQTIFIYSPGSAVAVIPFVVGTNLQQGSLCVFNDALYYTGATNGSTLVNQVYVLSGILQSVASLNTAQTGSQAIPGMFVDSNSGDLIIFNKKSTTTWGCWSLSSSHTLTDISSTVLPLAMQGTVGTTSRVLTFVDGESTPGADPNKYLLYANANTAGTLLTMFKWEGVSTTMTDIDFGAGPEFAFSLSRNCQGVGFWTSEENSVELLSRTPVSGGIRLSFKLYSPGGAATVSVRAFYGGPLSEYPTNLATITNNTNGSIISNVNMGLTANNGVTTYQFTWNSTTDGIDPGDRMRLILEVFV